MKEDMATLYRKYRPQIFSDLVGQDHIKQTLQAALATEKVGHAYLFAGPRGVGKTTVARLLAKAVNCQRSDARSQISEKRTQQSDIRHPISDIRAVEPCNECQMCVEIAEGRSLDVIEIDAASNRGIDEIRELRERIKFSPTQARKKVFIIDEVHMLTKEAFNALLKTLEEPPVHALFVLATTELNRVPATIASRCQVFMFKKASTVDLVARLNQVAEKEKLTLDSLAVAYLARLAGGSYRDAISLLDQISSYEHETITLEIIRSILGLASEDRLYEMFEALSVGNGQGALKLLSRVEAEGIDPDHFVNQLIETGRTLLYLTLSTPIDSDFIGSENPERWHELAKSWTTTQITDLIYALTAARAQMKLATVPILPLEIALIQNLKLAPSKNESNPPKKTDEPEKDKSEEVEVREKKVNGIVEEDDSVLFADPTASDTKFDWPRVLELIKGQNAGLHALLGGSEVDQSESRLVIRLPFQFAVDRLKERKHRSLLETVIHEVAGQPIEYLVELCVRDHVIHHTAEADSEELLKAATEIFELEEQTI